MRCWAVVPALALVFLAFVGRGEAAILQGRKMDHQGRTNVPKIEPRSLEAASTRNDVDYPTSTSGKTVKVDPRTEVQLVGEFNPRTEAQLVGEGMMGGIPSEINIPFFPTIEFMGLSLSLANVRIQGMDNFDIQPTVMIGKDKAGRVTFPKLALLADPYIAGGQLVNLPFVGNGTFNATVLDLKIHVHYRRLDGTLFCPTPNSTRFEITLEQLIVKFEDLNPGTNTGELINSMISAYGDDMMALLTLAVNNENLLHPLADKITVAIINKFCMDRSDATDPEAENREPRKVCSSQSSNDCGEGKIEVEEQDSFARVRGIDFTDLRLLENIHQHSDEWTQLLTTSLVNPVAEILEKSFKLE